ALASRAKLPERAVAVGTDRAELCEALAALGKGSPDPRLVRGRAKGGRLAFLFPGQGAEWPGMARQLLDESPRFAEQIGACIDALEPHLDFSLEDVLRGVEGAPSLDRIDVVQPATFATMVSLAKLWRDHGVCPEAFVGHSQGETAAAHLAGALSLEDAALIAARRSQAFVALAGKGKMGAVALPAEQVSERISSWGDRLALAVINGPASSVVSGEPEAVRELLAECEAEGIRTRELPSECATHWHQVEEIRERLLSDFAPIEPRSAKMPFYSTRTAGPLAGEELGPEYWYGSVRETVRFEATVQAMIADGFGAFVEASPHPTLTMAVQEVADGAPGGPAEVAAIGSLRRREGGIRRFVTALGEAQAVGVDVEWSGLLGERPAQRIAIPSYPFQRRRFWFEPEARSGDVGAFGMDATGHELLAGVASLPDERGWLLTGRLSLPSHPWLADHRVHGVALLPGTAFVEMALRAAAEAGASTIEELVIEVPLPIPEEEEVQVQVAVGPLEGDGARSLTIHSRQKGDEDPAVEWTANASGVLGNGQAEPLPLGDPDGTWPPAGAVPIDPTALYDRAAALGIDYGPAFQGVTAAWRAGESLFAEVALDRGTGVDGRRSGVHPALLDAALHPALSDSVEDAEGPRAPFRWRGVTLHRDGATRLRVELTPSGPDSLSLEIADAAGGPVASVESLSVRSLPAAQLTGAAQGVSLLAVDWVETSPSAARGGEIEVHRELATLVGDEPAPEVVAFDLLRDEELAPPSAAQAIAAEALAVVQAALSERRLADTRVAFLVHHGAVASAGDCPDPAAAAAWGLIRAAQAEHPGRFVLVDTDGSAEPEAVLAFALAGAEEPIVALREGTLLVPRLRRESGNLDEAPDLDPERTVLITGGTGALGRLFALHLAREHGARHLVLASRSGPDAPAAAELLGELSELGAEVRIAACDVGDHEQLEALLASLPAAHPLGVVVHSAGTLGDGVIESLDPERLAIPLQPKADAAWYLHELTRDLDLTEFILFSSAAASFGNPGQGAYAAANAFLDALAAQRAAEGLAACSIAWGPWERESEMTQGVGSIDRTRASRRGVRLIADAEGVDLFERSRGRTFAIASPLEIPALRALGRRGELQPLFEAVAGIRANRTAPSADTLQSRLGSLPEAERREAAVELVGEHVAAILGYRSAAEVDPTAPFKDLGFDSLGAVELRNRLGAASGMRLPATMVFDHPTVQAVAGFLLEQAFGSKETADVERELEEMAKTLAALAPVERARALSHLQSRLAGTAGAIGTSKEAPAEVDLDAASDAEILDLIDSELSPP
ncbi:MAG TPA: type I polyketide synthase, partial [Solirubrobacterales bacterium]|nr:type I polyketide synthase [Solirubrobacterales bacterium]